MKQRVLFSILACLSALPAWGQANLTRTPDATFFSSGFAAAGFGEIGLNSQKIIGEDAMVTRVKFGWQFLRNDYFSYAIGAGAIGLDKGIRYTSAEYDDYQFSVLGITNDIAIMPSWPAHLSISGLAGAGKMHRQREDKGEDESPMQEAHMETYDVGINGNIRIYGPAWMVLTYGQQVHNFDQPANIPVRKERIEYVSLGLRGSSM